VLCIENVHPLTRKALLESMSEEVRVDFGVKRALLAVRTDVIGSVVPTVASLCLAAAAIGTMELVDKDVLDFPPMTRALQWRALLRYWPLLVPFAARAATLVWTLTAASAMEKEAAGANAWREYLATVLQGSAEEAASSSSAARRLHEGGEGGSSASGGGGKSTLRDVSLMPLGAGWRAYREFWLLRGARSVLAGVLEEVADRWLFVQTAQLCMAAVDWASVAGGVWAVRVPAALGIAAQAVLDAHRIRARAVAAKAWDADASWLQLLPVQTAPVHGPLGIAPRRRIGVALLAALLLAALALLLLPQRPCAALLSILRYAVDWATLGFFDGSLTEPGGGGAGALLGGAWSTVSWLAAAGAASAPWSAAGHRSASALVLAWFFADLRFAFDHAYQGLAGVAFSFLMGLAFADCTARYGLGTAIVLHALWDLASETLLQAEGYLLRARLAS
jgi:hypothetical protein